MTTPNVRDMPAGREMDALVAEKVMGLENVQRRPFGGDLYRDVGGGYTVRVAQYSTDSDAALHVMERFANADSDDSRERYWVEISVDHEPWMKRDGPYLVIIHEQAESRGPYIASAPTLALAMCRAALAAVGAV